MTTPAAVLLNRLLARARFRHLQVMVRLAEFGSVRAAAQAIGLTQPAVTQLLADLEALLGVTLYYRHARGVLPTAVCRHLLPLARQSLAGLNASAEAVALRAGTGQGLVRIWASTAAINGLLIRALPAFNQRYPGIQLNVREADVDEQFMAVGRAEVDLCVCRLSTVVPEGWRFQPLIDDEFAVFCAPGHELTRRRKVTARMLVSATWVMSPIDSAARHRLDEVFAAMGEVPRLSQVITRVSSMTVAMLREQPALLTLAPASVFRPHEDAGLLVRLLLAQPLAFAPLGMVLPRRDVATATRTLADFVTDFCGPPGSNR